MGMTIGMGMTRGSTASGTWIGFCLGAALAAGLSGCGSLDSSDGSAFRPELSALRFTEIHYHPVDQDTVSGDEFEFLEIKNTGASVLSLTGIGITDGVDFLFPKDARLEAGAFLVLAANPDRFEQRYGFAPFGAYTGRLNNAGEAVVLTHVPSGGKIDSVEYSDKSPWPALADGDGYSLVPAADGAARTDAWRASFAIHGSPGKDDPAGVVINEVLTHTDFPVLDAIELFNPNDAPVDVGGWFLSDKRTQPMKFRIPAGTIIAAKGYAVFDEGDFNADSTLPNSFSLDAHGEEVWLSADSLGCGGRFCQGVAFGEIENGVTLGRYVSVHGQVFFPAQKEPTLGRANAGPRTGPVIFTEVMYHPADGAADSGEYVELANISADTVPLFDPDFPENTWKVGGFGFEFPIGVSLAPAEVVVILSRNMVDTTFRNLHGIPPSVRIFPGSKRLSNASDSLELLKPEEPYLRGSGTLVPYMTVEKMVYTDQSPWPSGADGSGKSLGRTDPGAFSGDPVNWNSIEPTPGKRP